MKLDFDIDEYLNPFLPRPWLHKLPRWLSWGLGYRADLPRRVPTILVWFWTFIGAFCGISVVQAVFERCQYFLERHVINIVGAFGATAVLLYGAIEAPFAQPRAIILGHTISALIGVGITKLFLLLPPTEFNNYYWLAGSLACATASTVMAITKTIHPPSGGTALMAATSVEIRAMGWYYVPVVMLSSVLMIAVGLITNNMQRRYPMFWWTSAPLKTKRELEEEKAEKETTETAVERQISGDSVEKQEDALIVTLEGVVVPEFLRLSYDQRQVLDELQGKIREYYHDPEHLVSHSRSLSTERSLHR